MAIGRSAGRTGRRQAPVLSAPTQLRGTAGEQRQLRTYPSAPWRSGSLSRLDLSGHADCGGCALALLRAPAQAPSRQAAQAREPRWKTQGATTQKSPLKSRITTKARHEQTKEPHEHQHLCTRFASPAHRGSRLAPLFHTGCRTGPERRIGGACREGTTALRCSTRTELPRRGACARICGSANRFPHAHVGARKGSRTEVRNGRRPRLCFRVVREFERVGRYAR